MAHYELDVLDMDIVGIIKMLRIICGAGGGLTDLYGDGYGLTDLYGAGGGLTDLYITDGCSRGYG